MYVLLPVVLAIWGTIGWKIYVGLKDQDEHTGATQIEKPIAIDQVDAARLPIVANYRDPFLDGAVTHANTGQTGMPKPKAVVAPVVTVKAPVETPLHWPEISYSGLIKRNGEEKVVGFLNVDGQSHFVKPGDKAGAVTVLKLWKDSIQLSWNKQVRVVRK